MAMIFRRIPPEMTASSFDLGALTIMLSRQACLLHAAGDDAPDFSVGPAGDFGF
jgi:hypothetical protein